MKFCISLFLVLSLGAIFLEAADYSQVIQLLNANPNIKDKVVKFISDNNLDVAAILSGAIKPEDVSSDKLAKIKDFIENDFEIYQFVLDNQLSSLIWPSVGKRDLQQEYVDKIIQVLGLLQSSNSVNANKINKFLDENGTSASQLLQDFQTGSYAQHFQPETLLKVKAFLQQNPDIAELAHQFLPGFPLP